MFASGNSRADKFIMTVNLALLEQARLLHLHFHLSPHTLLLPDLPVAQHKHLAWMCTTCTPLGPLGPLNRGGVNSRGSMLNMFWQTDITPHPLFINLKCVHVIVDTYSPFTFALAQTG